MNRDQIIEKLQHYFKIYELVDSRTYDTYGDDAWQFFETNILHVMLIIREGINKPIIVNTWITGGIYDERGLRTNLCEIVVDKTNDNKLYLSGHVLGVAIDFKVKGISSDDVRQWIVDNQDLFPCKVRLENNVTWVHIDTKYLKRNPKIYLFDV